MPVWGREGERCDRNTNIALFYHSKLIRFYIYQSEGTILQQTEKLILLIVKQQATIFEHV